MNFTNVKWCKEVSVDLVSVLKLSEIGFFCVLGMSDEEPVQIRCKKASQLIKRGVKINHLYWATIANFFDLAYRSGLKVAEHQRKRSRKGLQHCDTTLERTIIPTSIGSELFQWMGEAAYLAVAPTNEEGYRSDLAFDLCGVCNLIESSRRVDMIHLMHDRTEHGNANILIEAHNRQLVKRLKLSEKAVQKVYQARQATCDIYVRSKMTRLAYKKIHKILEKEVGNYISCDIAVFVKCEARHGFRYVAALTDHATKYCWAYPMRHRSELNACFNDFISFQDESTGCKS